jgi:hypothetical protein
MGKSAVELRLSVAGLPYSEGVRASSPGAAEDSSHTHKPYSQEGQSSWFGDREGMNEADIAEPDVPDIHPGNLALSRANTGKLTESGRWGENALTASGDWNESWN